MNTMQSGSKEGTQKTLTFERATNSAALCSFYCGQDEVDEIIHNAIDDNLYANDLYLVKEEQDIVAMFCLGKEKYCLFLPDDTKDKMKMGLKPVPKAASTDGEDYWDRFYYDAVELSLLAVKKEKRDQHIGSFIIEHVIDYIKNQRENSAYKDCEFLMVRALNMSDYTAVPFYSKCGFFPAKKEVPYQNLDMYRIIPK